MRKFVLLSAVVGASLSLFCPRVNAQDISVSASRHVLTNTKYISALIPGDRGFNSFDAAITWKSSGEWARLYGDPNMGFGVSWCNLGALDCKDGAKVGDSFAFYGTWMRDLLRLGPVAAGYCVQGGMALMSNPYHKIDNPLNDLYGGPLTFHFKAGVFLRASIASGWSINAEVAFKHNSAARLFIPNRGLNALSYSLGASYAIGDKTVTPGAKLPTASPLMSKVRLAVFAGGGIHRCMAEFEADDMLASGSRPDSYTPWFKGSAGIEAVWHYCKKTSTGLQAELHYISNTVALQKSDNILYGAAERSYSPWAPGLAIIQDFYIGSFTAGVGLGAYLFREVGIHENHGRLYQKVNIRYYPDFLPSFFAGISLRVHEFSRADYFEFSVGKSFGFN